MPTGTAPSSIARDPNASQTTLYLGTNRGALVSVGGSTFAQTRENFSPAYQVAVDYNVSPSIVYAGTIVLRRSVEH